MTARRNGGLTRRDAALRQGGVVAAGAAKLRPSLLKPLARVVRPDRRHHQREDVGDAIARCHRARAGVCPRCAVQGGVDPPAAVVGP